MCVAVKSRPCATTRENAFSDLEVFEGTECTAEVAELSGVTSNLAVAPVVKSSKNRRHKLCV